MTLVPISWLLIAACMSTVLAVVWCCRQDYSGDYNFTAIFTLPMAAAWIAVTWLIYFAARFYFRF